jgi:integrase
MIAQHHVGLPEKDIERIKRWRDPLILKYSGMTEKNERCVRLMRHPVRRENLKQLPAALMAAAHDLLAESPADAAVLALRATAIGLLSRLPIRLKNLLDLRINQHLQRDDPRQGRITFLAVQPDETKNNRAILMPVSPQTADLLEEWIKYFRPLVAAPGCLRLFPGHGTGDQPMTHQGMREAIKTTVLHHVGVALTPQQFRHVAADIFLEAYPGHYAEVQRLLGHKSLATTMRAYCSRDQPAAVRRYDELLDSIQTDRKPAKQRSARSRTFSKASKR